MNNDQDEYTAQPAKIGSGDESWLVLGVPVTARYAKLFRSGDLILRHSGMGLER